MQQEECFYVILGVDEKATPEEIRQAYKLLARQHHPDKNRDKSAESHEKFIKLQKAFETLSDPKERSWYDRNKASITFNGGLGSVVDPLSFRNLAAFDEFDDSPRGFFTIYRNIFEKIVQEELHFGTENIQTFPCFGYSYSSFSETVIPFYNFWNNFCSRKTFAWADKYDEKTCRNRQETRAVQRENKTFRDESRKKFNADVRSLVQFIKKRDPRIPKGPPVGVSKEKKIPTKEKPQCANVNDFDWTTHYENYHEDFDNIETIIQEEFDEKLNMSSKGFSKLKEFEYGVAIAEDDVIYCILCEHSSNSSRAFQNHCKSKMHSETFAVFLKNLKEENVNDPENEQISESIQPEKGSQNGKNKQSKSQKNKNKPPPEDRKEIDPLTCQTCGEKFPSRNQMFKHINELGHGILKEVSKIRKNPKSNKK